MAASINRRQFMGAYIAGGALTITGCTGSAATKETDVLDDRFSLLLDFMKGIPEPENSTARRLHKESWGNREDYPDKYAIMAEITFADATTTEKAYLLWKDRPLPGYGWSSTPSSIEGYRIAGTLADSPESAFLMVVSETFSPPKMLVILVDEGESGVRASDMTDMRDLVAHVLENAGKRDSWLPKDKDLPERFSFVGNETINLKNAFLAKVDGWPKVADPAPTPIPNPLPTAPPIRPKQIRVDAGTAVYSSPGVPDPNLSIGLSILLDITGDASYELDTIWWPVYGLDWNTLETFRGYIKEDDGELIYP